MFYAIHFQMVLIPKESKILTESHNEFADIANYLILYNSFIDAIIFLIYIFCIDVVEYVFILKHLDCFQGQPCIRDCFNEVIRNGIVSVLVDILF